MTNNFESVIVYKDFSLRIFMFLVFCNFFQKTLAFRRLLCYNIFRCKTIRFARLAQLAEHLTLNQGVQGSNP